MTEFTGLDANKAIVIWFGRNGSTLPERAYDVVADAMASPNAYSLLITGMEGLYKARAELETEGLELLRDLAAFISGQNFGGYAENGGRGPAIQTVAVRMLGGGDAEAEGDPVPDGRFNPPPPVPSLIPPVPGQP